MTLNKTSKFNFYKLKITVNQIKKACNDCVIKYAAALVATKTGQTPLQEVKCLKSKRECGYEQCDLPYFSSKSK